jgi:hypothetical protein
MLRRMRRMVHSVQLRKPNATLCNFFVQCPGWQVNVEFSAQFIAKLEPEMYGIWAGELTVRNLRYPNPIQERDVTSITGCSY